MFAFLMLLHHFVPGFVITLKIQKIFMLFSATNFKQISDALVEYSAGYSTVNVRLFFTKGQNSQKPL